MSDIHRTRLLDWLSEAEHIVEGRPQASAAHLLTALRAKLESGDLDVPIPERTPVRKVQHSRLPARGPATSFEAAALQTGVRVREKLVAIHGVLEASGGGLTDDEIAAALPQWNRDTVRNRRVLLKEKNWVRDSGRTRPSSTGSAMTVWETW